MKAQAVCTCEIRRSKMSRKVSPKVAYAIVRAGGRQEKVSVGDKITLDRVAGEPGSTIELPVLLLVDGDKITADAKSLASAKVTAEKIRPAWSEDRYSEVQEQDRLQKASGLPR